MKRGKILTFRNKAAFLSTAVLATAGVIFLITACAMPEPPTRTALVYGISIYDTDFAEGASGTNNLTYTDNDANDFADALDSRGWSVTRGIANTQVESQSLDATRDAMEADIASLSGTEGLVLFYYSGHGAIYNGEAVIIPFGAIETNEDLITASELFAMFEQAGLRNVVVILDSCYSGGFVEEGASVDAVPPVFAQNYYSGDIQYTLFVDALGDALRGYLSYTGDNNYIVISAAGSGEYSYENGTPYEHGIFTYFLLQAVDADSRNADQDSDGYVTTSELYAYCAAGIDKYWNSKYPSADYLPHLSGTAREYALWASD
jgi:hypothetical protein